MDGYLGTPYGYGPGDGSAILLLLQDAISYTAPHHRGMIIMGMMHCSRSKK